jgi:hypothetical protein
MRIPLVRSGGDNTPIASWEYLFLPAIMLFLFGLAVWSIPYFWLYPERHAHVWDFDENQAHERSLKRWRDAYGRLTVAGRVHRRWKKRHRWRRRRIRHAG